MDAQRDAAELAEQLRSVLALIESGDLPSERDQTAYLRGALAAVEAMVRE